MTGINRTYLQFLASIAVLLPYVLLTGGFHLAQLPAKGLTSLLVVGVGYTGIAYTLYFSSLRYLKGQEAAILSYIDPLVAVLVSVTVLAESVTWLQAAGGAMILGLSLIHILRPEDVGLFISYSGQTEELIKCAEAVKKSGAKMILITRFAASALSDLADYNLYVAANESLFRNGAMSSRISQLNMIDILYTAYANTDYERSMARLCATHP